MSRAFRLGSRVLRSIITDKKMEQNYYSKSDFWLNAFYQFGLRTKEIEIRQYFLCDKGEIFLDIGAERGFYSRYMASKVKEVHAFEPFPDAADLVAANCKAFHNVTVHNEALGSEPGQVSLFVHEHSWDNSIIKKEAGFTGRTITVPVKTADGYSFGGKIGLIKIDTEGAEIEVLKGALETIRKHRPRMIVDVHPPFDQHVAEIKQMLPEYQWELIYNPSKTGLHLLGVL